MENEYSQLCVWHGTTVGADQIKEFTDFFKEEYGVRVKYETEFLTLPGEGGEGGRSELLFYIHSEDIPNFAVKRLALGIRWWEDVLSNQREEIYPSEIYSKYPKTW